MTTVKFFSEDNIIRGFEIKGHSGFADKGEDIVCAGISSASIMAANTVTDVIGADASVIVEDGYIRLYLNESDPSSEAVLKGLSRHLSGISKQYPQFVRIILGGVKND